MIRTFLVTTLALAVAGGAALAQPKDDKPGDKGDAKSLLASGLKLYAAKDYLGALSVFQTAYARFPNGKILLNIGTALVKLDRKAEAANAYQGYLDSPDADPSKTADVSKVLAGLDAEVGVLELTVTPGDAEVQLDKGEWTAAAKLARTRVTPGAVTLHARKTGFKPAEQTATVDKGGHRAVALTLETEPVATAPTGATTGTTTTAVDTGIHAGVQPVPPPSKLGFLAVGHVDPQNKGGAALLGVAFDVADRIQLQAAALLGPSSGGYAGARVALTTGRVRPLIAAGIPIWVANGARVGVRGAGGVEIAFNRHFAVVAEVGVEHVFNAESTIDHATMFVPSAGVIGRL